MSSPTQLLLVVCLSAIFVASTSALSIHQHVDAGVLSSPSIIALSSIRKDPFDEIMQMSGAANCGTGDIRDIRFPGCTSAPCTLNRGQTYNIQVDFVPVGEYRTVFFKSILLKDNQIQTVTDDVHMPGTALIPGVLYSLNYDFVVPAGNFYGAGSELRIKVYQNFSKSLCLVVPSTIA